MVSPDKVLAERFAGRVQQQVTSLGYAAADDEPSGIHMRCQVSQPCPESLTDSLERSNGNAVAVQCRRGHVMTADAFGRPVAQRQQVLRLGAVGGAFTGLTYERVSAGVLLPAAAP